MPGPGLEMIGAEEIAEVVDVLKSRELSRYRFKDGGQAAPSKVYDFERKLEVHTGARHCLGMNSCTSALLVGLWASGLGRGDEVIVPGYTFIASIAAIAYANAIPILAEIDSSLTLDPADVRKKITPRTRAIMAVHMLGSPCDLRALSAIAREHDLILIEDCAQAGGGQVEGRALGTWGAFGAFSLNVFKTFTAGDGGVLLTNDTELYHRAFAIHDHGARPHRVGVADIDSYLGLNLRMHELTGAVARVQLARLPGILQLLRTNKRRLREVIGLLPETETVKIHDADGECATVLTYLFKSPEVAATVAAMLQTRTLAASGKHNYASMPQLMNHALPRGYCPRECAFYPFQGNYAPTSLPCTDALLARAIALSVGVEDTYLGTGFGIGVHATEAEILQVGETFRNTVLAALQAAK